MVANLLDQVWMGEAHMNGLIRVIIYLGTKF
jgi:hypothetical protein